MITKENILANIKNGTFPRRHFSQASINEISKSYLPQLIYWIDDSLLVCKGKTLRLAKAPQVVLYDHGAVNLYGGEFFPPLAFLQHYLGFDFQAALYLLNFFYYKVQKVPLQRGLDSLAASSHRTDTGADTPPDLNGILAEDRLAKGESKALNRTMAYLHNSRGIERDVVLNFIKQGFLKMDGHGNLCFITYADPLDKAEVIAVTKTGTTPKRYKGNFVKRPHTGFFYAPKPTLVADDYKEVFVFESPIDLMAYLSLVQKGRLAEGPGHEASRCYISLNGAGNRTYLFELLLRHKTITAVSLCLDNDEAGIKATSEIKAALAARPRIGAVHDLRKAALAPVSASFGYCKDWGEVILLPDYDLGVAV